MAADCRPRGRRRAPDIHQAGESEARVHRIGIEDVHFHEVGAADAILDICGVAAGLALLQVETLYCGRCHSIVEAAWRRRMAGCRCRRGHRGVAGPHGCADRAASGTGRVAHPTGAAILTTLARLSARRCACVPAATGGEQERAGAQPVRITLGEAGAASNGTGATEETLAVLACNLDDMNPQWYGHLFELLRRAGPGRDLRTGADEEGRPARCSTCCARSRGGALTDLLLAETTTLGVRRGSVSRHAAGRAITAWRRRMAAYWSSCAGGRTNHPGYTRIRRLPRLALEAGVTLASVSHAAQAAAYHCGTTYTSEEQQ